MRGEGKVRADNDKERETEKEKIRRVMRSLKEKKAAGDNEIPEEVWKYGGGGSGGMDVGVV